MSIIKDIKAQRQEYHYEELEVFGHPFQFRIRRPTVKEVLKFADAYPRAFKMVGGMTEEELTEDPRNVLEALESAEDVVGFYHKLILISTEYKVADEEWTSFVEEESEDVLSPADLGGEVVVQLGNAIFRLIANIYT